MRRWICLLMVVVTVCSCSNDGIATDNSQVEKWTLYRVTFPDGNTTSNNDDLDIADALTLVNDTLFYRERSAATLSWKLTGTYHYMEHENHNYIVLKYNDDSEIIGNCSGNLNEVFRFTSESEIYNIWSDCDGPKLEYKRQY